MSDTPRTDSQAFECLPSPYDGFTAVSSEFARQLERELAEARKAVLLLERALSPFLLSRPDGDIGWRGRQNALCGSIVVSDILHAERILGRKRVDELIEKAREAEKGQP